MNNKTTTQIITETLEGVKLPADARSRMRAELSSYADFHTLPSHTASFFGRTKFFLGRFPYAILTFLLVVIGGSVAFAAHGSLPGSPLYAMKLGVLEPIEKLLTVPGQTEAEWSVTLTRRRLNEADAVASTTQPSAQAEVQAAHEVADAARLAEKNIDALASSSRERASSAFTQALSEHENTLIRLAAIASSTDATTTEEVLNKLVTETHGRNEHDLHGSPDAAPFSDRARPEQVPVSHGNTQD